MKKAYPNYRQQGIDSDKLYKKLNSEDKKILDDFLKYCSITAGKSKLKDIRTNLLQFRDIIEVPYKKVDLKVLRDFLVILENSDRKNWTTNGIKNHIKRFYKELFKNWSERFNAFKDVRTHKGFNEEKINENTLVSPEELKIMCQCASGYRDKALIMTLYETAARPQEIRRLKWKDITFNPDGTAKVSLYSGKTETARTILIKDSVPVIEDWKQHYSYDNRTQHDFVFPSSVNREWQISDGNFSIIFKKINERAKFNRHIFPYLLRHTRLTELHKVLPEQIHKKLAGHTKDSRMTAVYSHISSEDVIESMLSKVYKVEKITQEQRNKYDKQIAELKKAIDAVNNKVEEIKKLRTAK